MLKGAVVRGAEHCAHAVRHDVSVSKIWGRQIENILGYDAKVVNVSTKDMPCGKGRVVHYIEGNKAFSARGMARRLKHGRWFGFAKVDIEVHRDLWPNFEEMCPLFINKEVRDEVVPYMQDYLWLTGDGGSVCREDMGIFPSTVVCGPRGSGESCLPSNRLPIEKDLQLVRGPDDRGQPDGGLGKKIKTLLANAFELLGNSSYGKLIKVLERQTNIICTKDDSQIPNKLAQRMSWKVGSPGSRSTDPFMWVSLCAIWQSCGCVNFTTTSSTGVSTGGISS